MYLNPSDKNNVIDCTVNELCDITLASNDAFQKWILAYADVWASSVNAKMITVDKDGNTHVTIQPIAVDTGHQARLVGFQHTYAFNLKASYKSKTNTYVFVDSSSLNSHNAIIDEGLSLNLVESNLDKKYYMKGDTDNIITPVRVFNDGEKTYLKMSDKIGIDNLPNIYYFGNQCQLLQANNPRYRKPYFIVDGLPKKIAVVSGNTDNTDDADKSRVNIYRGEQPSGWAWLMQQCE